MTAQQQGEEFRIRVLIGHMAGRNDAILEFMAEEIESGEAEYNHETEIIRFLDTGSRMQINKDGSFRGLK
jgi:hypothetical protein